MDGSEIMYRGQEVTLKSETGRFVLPPDYRKQVRRSSDDQRVLCLSLMDGVPGLVGFGFSRELGFKEQIREEAEDAKAAGRLFNRQHRWSQLMPGYTTPFDDSGRFVLPSNLLNYARITDRIYIHPAGPEFLILSPEVIAELGPEWDHVRIGYEGAAANVKPGKGGK